jgi:hypothetical protein
MLTFEKLCRAWMTAFNDHNPDELMSFLADEFRWVTFPRMDGGLDADGYGSGV